MSTQNLMRAFVLTSVAVLAGQTVAQDSTGELQSILVGEDLRPLIDLDAPSPTPVVTKSTASKPKLVTAPTNPTAPASTSRQKSVLKSVVKSASSSKSAKTKSKSKLVDTPPPLIPGFEKPHSETPTEAAPKTKVAPPAPVAKSILKVPATNTAANESDGAFDFGVATAESAAGLKVRGVFVDSPAQQLGVKPGDIIVAVNGSALKSDQQLRDLLAAQGGLAKPFPVTVVRAGQQKVLTPRIESSTASSTPAVVDSIVPPPVTIVENPTVPAQPTRQPYSQQSVLRRRVPARRASTSQYQAPQQIAQPSAPQASSTGTPTTPVSPATPPGSVVSTTQPRPYPVTGPNPTANRTVPSVTPRATASTQQRVVRYPQQPQARYIVRPAQPQYRTAPSRPVIGDGGRLIGNGRVINSALRAIGL